MSSTAAAPGRIQSISEEAQKRFYHPELDVLRFFAFFCIFLAHFWLGSSIYARHLQRALTVGLPLFFFLSSFLITGLLQREQLKTGTIHIKSFYVRRILRIWPLYLTFVTGVYLLWHNSLPPTEPITKGRFLSYMFLCANWYAVLKRNIGISPIAPLWSISVEEQFYLLWPFLYKLGGKTTATFVSALTLPIAVFAILWVTRQPNALDVQLWTNSFVIFIFFGAGALAALYQNRIPKPSSAWARVLLFIGSLLVAQVGVLFFYNDYFDASPVSFAQSVGRYTCMLLAAAGLFFSVYGAGGFARFPLLVYFGKISYGLYVFHMLAIEWGRECTDLFLKHFRHGGSFVLPAASLFFTFALAALSYRFFESPFLRLKEKFAFVKTRAV